MSGKKEERLLVVRAMELAANNPAREASPSYEFDVVVDVSANGIARFSPFEIRAWDVGTKPPGERYSLVLTMTNPGADGSDSDGKGKEGLSHGSSLPEEICSLTSVMLRRRVELGPLVRRNNLPMRYAVPEALQSPALVRGTIELGAIPSLMSKLAEMPSELHGPYLLACRFYKEALELLDARPDVAYVLLVSAAEVLVARLTDRPRVEDLSPELRSALDQIPEPHRTVVSERLLADRAIGARFVNFLVAQVRPSFWEESPGCSPSDGRVEDHELRELLEQVYNQRSRTLHEGQPFPPNIKTPPDSDAEIDRRSYVSSMGRTWQQSEFVPYVRFFERLVQHVLVGLLGPKAAADSSAKVAGME